MTRKHFRAIAKAIRDCTLINETDREIMAYSVASFIHPLCDNFNVRIFIEECKPSTSTPLSPAYH